MECNRERYTPTDVGPSPAEWRAPLLSEVSTLITNGFVGTATPYYTDETGIPYLYGKNVRANRIDRRDIRYIMEIFHEEQEKTSLRKGDLPTVQSGHIGETAVVPGDLENANCHALIVTRLLQDKAFPNFLGYYINSEIGRARMRGLVVGSTILHINTKDLKKFRVLLPSLPEQRKIAKILQTWDRAIATTEELIDASKRQKKAVMQQLLTGKKRFSGFEGNSKLRTSSDSNNSNVVTNDWILTTIGTIAKVKSGGTPSRSKAKYWDGSIPWVTTAEIKYSHVLDTKERISEEGLNSSSATLFPIGTILIAMYSQGKTRGQVAKLGIEAATNQDCAALFLDNQSEVDFFYQYLTDRYDVIRNLSNSGGQKNLSAGIIKSITVPLPPLQEQRKIAKTLGSADKEIDLLQKKLIHLKQEKKALMQQLLTGKRRVKVDE